MVVGAAFERNDDHVGVRRFYFGERSGAGAGNDQIGRRVGAGEIGLGKEIVASDVGEAGKFQPHGSVEFSEHDFEIDAGNFFRRFENRFEHAGRPQAPANCQNLAFRYARRGKVAPGNARIEQLS